MRVQSNLCKLFRDNNIEYNFAIHGFQLASGALHHARHDKMVLAPLVKRANQAYRRFRGWPIMEWLRHLVPGANDDVAGGCGGSVSGLNGGGVGDDSTCSPLSWERVDMDEDDDLVVRPGAPIPDGSDLGSDHDESGSDGELSWSSDVIDEDGVAEIEAAESISSGGGAAAMDTGVDTGTDGTVHMDTDVDTGTDGTVHMADGSGGLTEAGGVVDTASWRDTLVCGLRDAVGEEDLESFSLRGLREALRSDRLLELPDACTDYVELLRGIAAIWRPSPGDAEADPLRSIAGVLSLTWGSLECRDWPRMPLRDLRHAVEKQLRRKENDCLSERATVVELIAEVLSIDDRCGTSDQLFSSTPLDSGTCVACVETQKEQKPVFHQCCRPCDPEGSRFCVKHAKSSARRLGNWDADPFHRHLPYDRLKAGRRACKKRRQGAHDAVGQNVKGPVREGLAPDARDRLLRAARTTMAGRSPMTTTASCLLSLMRSVDALPLDVGPVGCLDVFAVMVELAREYEQAAVNEGAEQDEAHARSYGSFH